jgi:amino acid transporter
MTVGSFAAGLSALISLLVLGIFLLFLAAVGIGAVSAVIHDRGSPESLREWGLWLSRGIAYITIASTGTLLVFFGLAAQPVITIILLGVFLLAGVGVWSLTKDYKITQKDSDEETDE